MRPRRFVPGCGADAQSAEFLSLDGFAPLPSGSLLGCVANANDALLELHPSVPLLADVAYALVLLAGGQLQQIRLLAATMTPQSMLPGSDISPGKRQRRRRRRGEPTNEGE